MNSGDTHDLAVLDFDGDNDADLVTIDADGLIRFYENRQVNGYVEIGRPVQAVTTGKLSYGLSVHLGTTRMLVNNQARVIWPTRNGAINQILPFGKSLAEDTPEFESYKLTFTSKELDHDLDLHYFGARYYHAFLPRFISPDPEGGDPKVPLSWNRYLYCRDDPVNYTDPTGNDVEPERIISGNELIDQIYEIEQANPSFTPEQVLEAWNKIPFKERDCYLAAPNANPQIMSSLKSIDIKHFMRVAEVAKDFGESLGELAGHFNEWRWLFQAKGSFYDLEDIPSNKFGAIFGGKLSNEFALSTQLRLFFEEIGIIMDKGPELENHIKWIENVHPPGQKFYKKQ